MNSPWHHFVNNQKNHIQKAFNYFHAYERHFSRYAGTSVTMFEIGVQNGGSAQMWKSYLGPMATIVGIDIDPRCKQAEEHAIHVRIGSQDGHAFLEEVVSEFGVPDIVLDDGSHQASHIKSTFEYLFPLMRKNSVYMVEDLCCAYWPEYGGDVDSPDSFINIAKSLVDRLNATHSRGAIPVDAFTQTVSSISFYDAVVAIEKHPRVDGYAVIGNHGPVWDPYQ